MTKVVLLKRRHEQTRHPPDVPRSEQGTQTMRCPTSHLTHTFFQLHHLAAATGGSEGSQNILALAAFPQAVLLFICHYHLSFQQKRDQHNKDKWLTADTL